MAHDTSHPCPCGSGRKVKFCCGKPVAAELEKIQRAIQGEQQAAALNLTRLARQKWPDNPALLTLQAELELVLGEQDAWPETVEHLGRVAPGNPTSHALAAIQNCQAGRWAEAMDHAQTALEAETAGLPHILYEALGVVAHTMIVHGNFSAGLALLHLQTGIAGVHDERPHEMLRQVEQLGTVPFLLRYQRLVRVPDESIATHEQAGEIVLKASMGCWRQARQLVEQLCQVHPQNSDLLYDLGVLNMRLGDLPRAVDSWRQLAALPDLPLDEAVEAEALAQVLHGMDDERQIHRVQLTFRVTHADQVLERLLSSRLLVPAPDDAYETADEDEVPPKAAFMLLDRNQLSAGTEVSWREIPCIVGAVLLYGKQTDRDARLELILDRDPALDDFKRQVQAILGDTGHWESETELEDESTDLISHALTWRWRLPEGMTEAQIQQAMTEKQRVLLGETVPRLPLSLFDGKCLAEAASDPAYRVRALGLLLNLQLQGLVAQWQVDFNALRRELGLPEREIIRGPLEESESFPLERMPYVQLDSLSDDDLVTLLPRSFNLYCWSLLKPLADEAERRAESLGARVNWIQMYAVLSNLAPTSELVLDALQKAGAAAEASGNSPAPFLLAGLMHQLRLGRAVDLRQTLERLASRHASEPGVAEKLQQFIAIMQQGARAAARRQRAEPASDQPPASKLWTPDSDQAPAASGGKSKLWVPGMD